MRCSIVLMNAGAVFRPFYNNNFLEYAIKKKRKKKKSVLLYYYNTYIRELISSVYSYNVFKILFFIYTHLFS